MDGPAGDVYAVEIDVVPHALGGAASMWGRIWTPAELSNANFRVRITNVANSTSRDFTLDWIAVRISY